MRGNWIRRHYSLKIWAPSVVFAMLTCIAPAESALLDAFDRPYEKNCAICHGENMEGSAQAPPLVGRQLTYGDTIADLTRSIGEGFPDRGMPGFATTLDQLEISRLAILIAESREDLVSQSDFGMYNELIIPTDTIETELETFLIDVVATDIDPYSFSIAPLANGEILVTEKERGISIISPDGQKSAPVEGAPATSDRGRVRWGLNYGIGWHLDVAPHPDYGNNGWIYLHHGDLRGRIIQTSMNRLVRGRIKNGQWIDEQVIWSVPGSYYNVNGDLSAGGRIAFDTEGFVYLSIGDKAAARKKIQDLATPYGKVHRVHDDGTIPSDNPFIGTDGAMASIWTYGHRNPQGLEFDPATGTLWNSEMGPRGGDELNLLLPGKNYGWPLHSKGLNYNGSPVDGWKKTGMAFTDIEQPVVDFTPAPAISSFIIYDGDAFPGWNGNFLVGSLKATELYRVEIKDGKHVRTEVLLENLARIRDIESGPNGHIYLLLEHDSGSQIVKLVPARP